MATVPAHPADNASRAIPLSIAALAPAGGRAVEAPAEATPPQVEPLNWAPALCLAAATGLAGIVGVPLGFLLGWWSLRGEVAAVPWVGLVQAHGQVQLFGWIGLAVLGVTLHAMAHLFRAQEPPARTGFTVLALQVSGVALRVAAPFVPGRGGAALLLGAAVAFAGAFAVTLEAHARTLPRRPAGGRAPAALPRFLLPGLVLWRMALLVTLAGARAARRIGPVAPGALAAGRDAFVVAATTGGLALVALGMSMRVVVGWLDLPAPDLDRAGAAWLPLVAGAVLRAAAAPLALPWLGALAELAWALGVLLYLSVLRGRWAPGAVHAGGGTRGEADPALAWFVRTAYAWLAVSGGVALGLGAARAGEAAGFVLSVPAGLADAGRHALLFGFLGVLTAGLAGRLPGAFLDVEAPPTPAMRACYRGAWGALVVASTLRVAAALLGDLRAPAIAGAGVAGALGLWCVLAVIVQIARAASAQERPARMG
jgi:hypothetical protein